MKENSRSVVANREMFHDIDKIGKIMETQSQEVIAGPELNFPEYNKSSQMPNALFSDIHEDKKILFAEQFNRTVQIEGM